MLTFIIDMASGTPEIVSTASGLIGDFMPLIVVIIGIDIAFIIFTNIMDRKK